MPHMDAYGHVQIMPTALNGNTMRVLWMFVRLPTILKWTFKIRMIEWPVEKWSFRHRVNMANEHAAALLGSWLVHTCVEYAWYIYVFQRWLNDFWKLFFLFIFSFISFRLLSVQAHWKCHVNNQNIGRRAQEKGRADRDDVWCICALILINKLSSTSTNVWLTHNTAGHDNGFD